MTEKFKKSRWQNITFGDVACLFYWAAIFISICVIFNSPIDFRYELNLASPARKFIFLFGFWISSICIIQTISGIRGIINSSVRVLKSPFSAIKVFWSFLWDSQKVFRKYKKQLPIFQIFAGILTITIALSLTETNPAVLKILLPITKLLTAWTLFYCFKWTLNPIAFTEKARSMEVFSKAKTIAVNRLSSIQITADDNPQDKLLSHLKSLKQFVPFLLGVVNFFRGPKLLFASFVGIFAFGAISCMSLVSAMLRIEHFITPGGVFSGSFFSNSVADYFYISLNHFMSSEIYGIEVISPTIRFILSFLPIASLTLTLLLVLAFTMVGQTSVDNTFKQIGTNVIGVIEEATKRITEKPETILVIKDTDKNVKVSADQKKSKITVESPVP